ncbi:MAG TPA: hypothetical protein VH062_21205 [Polyangiaceae bacterium]|jgi:hypothetical protein|nr:hypothetical protein [Polyangiaceae bacterium]
MADVQPTTGSSTRRVVIAAGGGALAGLAGSSLGGPAVISWWYEPPSRDAFSCAGSVKSALSQFVVMQFVCAAIGGVILSLIVFFIRRAMAKRQSARAQTAT